MGDAIKEWGLVAAVVGWAVTIGKFIQIIAQQGKVVEQLEKDSDSKTIALVKITEWMPEAKGDILKLKTDMIEFRTIMATSQREIAVALTGLNENLKHLTDVAERNIVLTNNRLAKLEDKTDNYDVAIKDFYTKYELPLRK